MTESTDKDETVVCYSMGGLQPNQIFPLNSLLNNNVPTKMTMVVGQGLRQFTNFIHFQFEKRISHYHLNFKTSSINANGIVVCASGVRDGGSLFRIVECLA
jgi:hypothetical protein